MSCPLIIYYCRGSNDQLKSEEKELFVKDVFMKIFSGKEQEIKWYVGVHVHVLIDTCTGNVCQIVPFYGEITNSI